MLENSVMNVVEVTAEKIPNWFVICMGIGTVFIGLVCIIIICEIMSYFCREGKEKQEISGTVSSPSNSNRPSPVIENRQEIIAAVCAAAAEEMGTDISAIRVISFKKL